MCNPSNLKCSPLTAQDVLPVVQSSLEPLTDAQSTTIARFYSSFPWHSTYFSIRSRGAARLLASDTVSQSDLLQTASLLSNQWQLEVNHWFATSMAKFQQQIVRYATGPLYVPPGATILHPSAQKAQYSCNNQIIRAPSGTMSFSVLGLSIILIVGGLLILVSLVLDPLVNLLRNRLHWQDFKRVHWIVDEKLQLQRLAYEEAKQGIWRGGDRAVPVIRAIDVLGLLDDTDPRHPRLSDRGRTLPGALFESETLINKADT